MINSASFDTKIVLMWTFCNDVQRNDPCMGAEAIIEGVADAM